MSGLGPEQLQELARQSRASRESERNTPLLGGYFEAMTDMHFRTLDDGRRVFYPQGVFGRRGYIVESGRLEKRLRRRAWTDSIATILSAAFLGSAYGAFFRNYGLTGLVLLIATGAVASWLAAKLAYWPLIRQLERSHIANSPIACWRRLGQLAHPAWLIFGVSLLAALSALGFFLYAHEGLTIGIVMGLYLIPFTIPYGIALRSWWRHRAA